MTSNPKVMIAAEDRDAAREIEQAVLALGYELPVRVSSGTEAVIILPDIEPDIVIIDIELGGSIDGIQAAHDIYENYRIPVIYLVASPSQELLDNSRRAYPFGYLLQPLDEGVVKATLLAALEHHQLEEELRQSKQRLWRMQRIAGLGYWEWDIEHDQVTLSEELMAVFGFNDQPSTHSIQSIVDKIHPQDLDAFQTRIKHLAQGILTDEKLTFRIKGGGEGVRWVEMSPASILNWDQSGTPRRWLATLNEITAYMQGGDDILGREAYLATINKITRAALKCERIEEIHHVLTEGWEGCFRLRAVF